MSRRYFKAGEVFCFSSFVVLIAIIGLTGIFQIRNLNAVVGVLGTRYSHLQQAILEMRINNSLYGRTIRDLAFWQTTRFLESAPHTSNQQARQQAIDNFDRYLTLYSANISGQQQKEWVQRLKANVVQLRALGEGILSQLQAEPSRLQFKDVSRQLMSFENRLYKIDDFLSNVMEKSLLEEIDARLIQTKYQSRRAVVLLGFCSLLSIIIGALIGVSVYRREQINAEKKQQLFSQILKFEDEERQDISLQIHNEMGQNLSALKIHLELGNLEQCKTLLAELMDKMHNIVYFLRPPALEEVGLGPALEALLLQYHQIAGFEYRYHQPAEKLRLAPEYQLIFYRLTQEALNNIAKYARARNVTLSLQQRQNKVELSIEDDGVGFDYNHFRREKPKGRLGLRLLKERIEFFEGRMSVRSVPGEGTRITAEFPIKDREDRLNKRLSSNLLS